MASKKKKIEMHYVVAVVDYEKTMESISDGTIYVPQPVSVYTDILASSMSTISEHKDIRKFIKLTKMNKKEVRHYWESLVSNGYTLFFIRYEKEDPTIESLFNTNVLKFVTKTVEKRIKQVK